MQRYRVNYILLVSLVVGFFVSAGACYGLWRFQVDRNATRLLAKADAAEKEGDVLEAYESLDQYVRLRGQEQEARRRLGETAVKIFEQKDLDMTIYQQAHEVLSTAVVKTDDPKLRRKFVDIQFLLQRWDLALVHINQLLDAGHGDAELKALKAQCLFMMQRQAEGAAWCSRLVGFDQKAGTFDAAKAEAPDQPAAYWLLAQHLHVANKQPEFAQRVIDQMIAVNPESRESFMYQYQYLKLKGDNEGARVALDKAHEIEPTDAGVINAKGIEAILAFQTAFAEAQAAGDSQQAEDAKSHLAEAARFFSDGLKRYPDRMDFYERAARIEMFRDQPKEALAIVQKGLDRFPLKKMAGAGGMPLSIKLSNLKVEIMTNQKEFEGVAAEIKLLRSLGSSQVEALADFHEARVTAINEKWAEAAMALKKVKGRLVGFPDEQALASAVEGFCYQRLGQLDLAREAYKAALNINPNMPQALAGKADVERGLGVVAEDDEAIELDRVIQDMIARPKAEQDWDSVVEQLDVYIEKQAKMRPVADAWVRSRKALLRGQMYGMRASAVSDEAEQKQLFQEARKAITEAYSIDKEDPTILLHAIKLLAQEPGNGPTEALKRLDAVVAQGKDSAAFRMLRIDLLFAIRGEDLLAQLDAATQGMEDWQPGQQAQVWSTLAARYEQLGKPVDALRCLEKAAELAPNSLPIRMAMFDLALKQTDDVGMRKAQGRILEIVKSETTPTYVLTEVKRRIVGQHTGSSTREELKEARALLNQAIKQRENWSELYVTSAQLYMILEQDHDKALASLNEALQHGATNLNAVALQVRLLAERGRMQEARQTMDRIPAANWSVFLDRAAADVLLATGESDKAFAEAEKIATARAQDDKVQAWFGEVAKATKKPEAAEAALKKAVELNPADPDNWTRLVSLYLELKRPNDVERTLRESHLALDEEYLPLLTGKYYELQSRWHEAEDIYLTAFASRMEEIPVARRMAEFYLTWASQDEANRGKAARHLNRILRASYEGNLPKNDPHAAWARRQAAQVLARSGSYQDSLKAERMLLAALASDAPSPEDQELLIDILSLRNDPGSRERAIAMLRQIKQERGGLTAARELHLGHALFALGDWEAAKKQMLDAIGRYKDDIGLKTAYTSMLIKRKDFKEADLQISRLSGVREAAAGLGQLRLELAAARGNKDQVRAVLTSMTPDLRVLKPEQLVFLGKLAQLADEVGDHEYALDLTREHARRAPGNELNVSRLTALYGNLDEGLAMLKQLFDGRMDDVLMVAIEVLRARRTEAPEKLDEEIGRMVRMALRDDPESARRLMLEAEMLEVQEKFEESIAAYSKLLARDDVPELIRATAANNLAFLVALKSDKPEDLDLALKSVNDAIEFLGPISDILDTRALVHLARGQYAEAAADMKLSVKMNPTPSKFYHLAAAQLAAGDEQAAITAWERAKAEGIAPEKVSELEREKLNEFTEKMEALRSTAQL